MTYLDIIAGSTELVGTWIIGNKIKWGYIINLICCVMWIVFVIKSQTAYGILLVVIPAMIINVRNFIRWNKDDKQTKIIAKALLLYPQESGLYLVTKPTASPVKYTETIMVLKEENTNKFYICSDAIQYVDSPILKQWEWYGPITLQKNSKIDIDKSLYSDNIC